MSTNATAPAQSTGLPPVEDEDIKVPASDQSQESKSGSKEQKASDSKTEKRDESQPPAKEAEAKEKGPGPWTQKLAEAGLEDPAFDEFLRTEVQPYITQLEQGGAVDSDDPFQGDVELRDASFDLVQALRENPEQAYAELGELLGLTSADPEVDGMDGEEAAPGYDEGTDGAEDEAQEEPEEMAYVRQLMEREEMEKQDAELKEFLDQLGERIEGFDPDLYISALLSAQGDLDATLEHYMKMHNRYGLTERAREAAKSKESPEVLGPEGGTPPPETPKYSSLDDAINSYMSEERDRKSRK